MSQQEDLISLGFVGQPHGLKGAFFVAGRRDLLPGTVTEIYLGPSGQSCFSLKNQTIIKSRPVLSLGEFPSRTLIEGQRGSEIFARRSDLGVDEDTEYLWADLIGNEIQDAANLSLGVVKSVANYGASDILEVEKSGHVLMIPLVENYFDLDLFRESNQLKLVVGGEVFDEAWERVRD